jgi:hypothetical protein
MGRWTLGSDLNINDQRRVLAAYVHRYTGDHVPDWVRHQAEGKYPLQFASDADWLASTTFRVRADGRLDDRVKRCQSRPTWPTGKPDDMVPFIVTREMILTRRVDEL